MSMLSNTLLNQTILDPKIVTPSDVLNFLNNELPKNLKSSGLEANIRDGMDMSICIFDFVNKKMLFAGANNPCWIIRDHQLIILKGDKQAISASSDFEKRNFSNQEFDLLEGDMVYLFTDGYADQFGGPKGKKFKYRQLGEILRVISELGMDEQSKILRTKLTEWKGEHEQVDDVLILGIRV